MNWLGTRVFHTVVLDCGSQEKKFIKKIDRVNEEILSPIIWIHRPSPPNNELLFPWTLKKQLIHIEKTPFQMSKSMNVSQLSQTTTQNI